MNGVALKSEGMTPIEETTVTVRRWKCRHCKHRWPIQNLAAIANPELRPKQCPNRTCRAADWDRPKKKAGRPRKPRRRKRNG